MARVQIALASAVTVASVLATAAGIASCSLGLDESLIERAGQPADDGAPPGDSGAGDAKDGAPPPPTPEGGLCARDEDCKNEHKCLTAKCDLSRKACVFDVCRTPACNSAACDTSSQACGAPKPYKYRAGSFPVGAGMGCGGAGARCFAAVHPFLFVGTSNGVIAFDVTDPQSAAPRQVPVVGLGFLPQQILASGSRILFLGAPTGVGASSRVPLAWADVPADPFVTKITVQSVLATHNRPAADGLLLFARQNDTALLLDTNAASSYPAAALEPPLVEPLVLTSTPLTFTAGTVPVAASGTRLVMEAIGSTGTATFGFINGAGSAAPVKDADVALAPAGSVAAPQAFAQSADGALVWHVSSLTAAVPAPPAPPPPVRAAKAFFLVADGAASFDPAAGVDTEVYTPPPPYGTAVAGPVAMLDGKTALVTSALPGNLGQTSVQFVTRQPLAVVKDRKFVITLPVTQLAATASNGIGYVLAVDPATPAAPTVYVFDPACAP
jgi:hypothetical protein